MAISKTVFPNRVRMEGFLMTIKLAELTKKLREEKERRRLDKVSKIRELTRTIFEYEEIVLGTLLVLEPSFSDVDSLSTVLDVPTSALFEVLRKLKKTGILTVDESKVCLTDIGKKIVNNLR